MDIQEERDLLRAIEAVQREAAELIMHAHGILAEAKTGRRDVVTEYDRRVQQLLIDRLGAAVPGARFFCEENGRRDELNAERLFIIDPIDGTMNFVHGFNHSCVSVACVSRGQPVAAAVYDPYMDEMFTAVKGGGAFLNGRPVHVSGAPLAESVVCFGTAPYKPQLSEKTFRMALKVQLASLDLRRRGSAALDLCYVAAGRAGAYFELEVAPWDYAAGLLIVRESGGVCTKADGSPLGIAPDKTSILAGGPLAAAELTELLKG